MMCRVCGAAAMQLERVKGPGFFLSVHACGACGFRWVLES